MVAIPASPHVAVNACACNYSAHVVSMCAVFMCWQGVLVRTRSRCEMSVDNIKMSQYGHVIVYACQNIVMFTEFIFCKLPSKEDVMCFDS